MAPRRPLFGGAVELDHPAVETGLIHDVHSIERGTDFGKDVLHRFAGAFAQVARLVVIAKFYRFVLSRGCAGGNGCAANVAVGDKNVCLYGGVAAGVEDLASDDFDYVHCFDCCP